MKEAETKSSAMSQSNKKASGVLAKLYPIYNYV